MNDSKERNWRPLSFISTFEGYLDQLLEDLESQWALFVCARDNPLTIDGDVIKRSQGALKMHSEDIAFYQEQIARWKQEARGGPQQKLLESLAQKLSKVRALNSKLLDLTKCLSRNIVNKVSITNVEEACEDVRQKVI